MMGQRLVKSTGCRRADPPLQRRSSFIIMQSEEQQTLKINVQANAKNFDFKFKSTQIAPAWKLHRLSISLKLRNFFLRANSESTVHHRTKQNSESTALVSRRHPQQQQKQPLKSRVLKIFKKLRIRRAKKPRYPEAESFVNRLKQFAYEVFVNHSLTRTHFFIVLHIYELFLHIRQISNYYCRKQ